MSECDRIDSVVHLQLVHAAPGVLVLLGKALERLRGASEPEAKLSGNFGNIKGSHDLALVVLGQEIFDQGCGIWIGRVDVGEGSISSLGNVVLFVVLIKMSPGQLLH